MIKTLILFMLCFAVVLATGCSKKTKVRAVNGDFFLISGKASLDTGGTEGNITGLKIGSAELEDLAVGEVSGYEKEEDSGDDNHPVPVTASSITIFTGSMLNAAVTISKMSGTNYTQLLKEQKNTVSVSAFYFFGMTNFTIGASDGIAEIGGF